MKPLEFARVCDSLQPLIWALAILAVAAAGLYLIRWSSGNQGRLSGASGVW